MERRVRPDRDAGGHRRQAQRRPQHRLRQRGVIDRLTALNVDVREDTPDEFRAFVAAEMEKWSRVVREANIKLE